MNNADMPSPPRSSTVLTFAFGMLLSFLMPLSLAAQPAQAQDSGPSEQQKAMHYSLYWESFKNDNFKSAKGDLEWIIENAPDFPDGDARNIRRHYELYEGLAKQAESKDKRLAYLDTAATHLATATERMDKHGIDYKQYKWELKKGRFLEEHQDALPKLSTESLKDPKTHYRKAFVQAPHKIDPYYIQQVLRAYLNENQQEKALAFANLVEEKCNRDDELGKILSSVRNEIFGKNPQAKINYLQKQLEANPDSAKVMLDLFDAYVQRGNVSKASKLAPKLMKTNPPAETVREIAEMRLENGRAEKALKGYEKAAKQGAEFAPEDYINRGDAYKQMGSYSKARSEYQKALEKSPDFGRAYLAIGNLYTDAVRECSGEIGRKDRAVYWAAVDKYRKAMEIDSTLASTVESNIDTYRKEFPERSDIHMSSSFTDGETFTIDYGCYSWINETTKVREAP